MANLVNLILKGIEVERRPGMSGRDQWSPEECQERYSRLFGRNMADKTIVAVGHDGYNYEVKSPGEIRAVWRDTQQVEEVLAIPNDLWIQIRAEALA